MASSGKTYSFKPSVHVSPLVSCTEPEYQCPSRYTSISGQDTSKPLPYNPTDPVTKQVHASFQKSLANLHTTYLDSYILHSPLKTVELTLEAWRVLMELQDEGRVHKIGVSNTYDVSVLEALGRERKVQVVQNRWYQGNNWDKKVIAYCKENGVQYQFVPGSEARDSALICATFLRSFWTLSGSPELLSHPDLLAVATAAGCTPAQALFRFAQTAGITPLSGTTSEIHMREDIAVENLDLRDSRHMRSLEQLVL